MATAQAQNAPSKTETLIPLEGLDPVMLS